MCYCAHFFQHESSSSQTPISLHKATSKEEEKAEQAWRANHKKPLSGPSRSTNLYRSSSVKDLIGRFSGPDNIYPASSLQGLYFGRGLKAASVEALLSSKFKSSPYPPSSAGPDVSAPSITVTPPFRETSQNEAKTSQITARIDCPVESSPEKTESEPQSKTQTTDSGRESMADSGLGSVSKSPLRGDGATAWHCSLSLTSVCIIKAQNSTRMTTRTHETPAKFWSISI